MSEEFFVIDLAKGATARARYTIRVAENALSDVVSMRLVNYFFNGVENTVNAGRPDVPYYILEFSKEFPAAVKYVSNMGTHWNSYPLMLPSAPLVAVDTVAAQEFIQPGQVIGKLAQFELEIKRPSDTSVNLPQTVGSSVSRGAGTVPAFTDGFLLFAIRRASSRLGETSENTTGKSRLAAKASTKSSTLTTVFEETRAELATPAGRPQDALRRGMRAVQEPF